MIKAVLFDFSQTLADTAEDFHLAENKAQTWLFAEQKIVLDQVVKIVIEDSIAPAAS